VPILVTFDLSSPRPRELNRIRGAFERLGWGRVGNTAYRFPPLDAPEIGEDWLNRVVPALMLLRALACHARSTGRAVVRFTLDTNSSTGFDVAESRGRPVQTGDEIELLRPSIAGEAFANFRLIDWLDGIEWPYAGEEDAGP
jgi:hypothetical protein